MKQRGLLAYGTAVCCLVLALSATALAVEYSHSVQADEMMFAWKVDGDNLAVKISAETDGWVGIGFNPSRKMQDANFILGYVKGDTVKLTDEFGITSTSHKEDEKLGTTEDVTLVGGTEKGGVTTIEFIIPLNSGDKHDGVIAVDGDTVVLLAYGAGRDSFRSRHKFRTTLTVNLSTGATL